jgi:hypothetical protein
MEPFEQHLRRQPLCEVPPDWRAEILAAARAAAAPETPTVKSVSLPVSFHDKIKAWLWPHPIAWSALGACWVVILAVNISLRDSAPLTAQKETPLSAETLTELKRERLMFVELTGAPEPADADRGRNFKPQPRTEISDSTMV